MRGYFLAWKCFCCKKQVANILAKKWLSGLLDHKDGSRADTIGRIRKFVGGAHTCAWEVNTRGNREIIVGSDRSRTGYFKHSYFKLI